MYEEILNAARLYGRDKLILIMLGPTAKVLAYDLYRCGYWAIDLGHVDSEYEWFLIGARKKVKLKNKHTAENNFDEDISFSVDESYQSQIVVDLSD